MSTKKRVGKKLGLNPRVERVKLLIERFLFLFLLFSFLATSITFVEGAAVTKEELVNFEISQPQTSIKVSTNTPVIKLDLASSQRSRVSLKFTSVEGTPIDKYKITRVPYKYFAFDTNNLDMSRLSKLELTINISKQWAVQNELHNYQISLYQYDFELGGWRELKTDLLYSTSTVLAYKVRVSEGGYFAIADNDALVKVFKNSEPEAGQSLSDSLGKFEDQTTSENIQENSNLPDVEMPTITPSEEGQGLMSMIFGLIPNSPIMIFVIIFVIIISAMLLSWFVAVKLKGALKLKTKFRTSKLDKVRNEIAKMKAAQKPQVTSSPAVEGIKHEIENLEPVLIQKFFYKMSSEGYNKEQIKMDLLSRNFKAEMIDKVLFA